MHNVEIPFSGSTLVHIFQNFYLIDLYAVFLKFKVLRDIIYHCLMVQQNLHPKFCYELSQRNRYLPLD